MLTTDPKLPFLSLAWSPNHMGEILDRRVLPAVMPGASLANISIEDVTYSPGRKCFVLYSLEFADDTAQLPTRALATFAKDDRLSTIYDHHYGGRGDRSAAAAIVSEYQCLVEFFPTDWQLPTLARAMSPSEMGSAAVHTIHYCPHRRCVLRYADGTGGKSGAVGKLFPSLGEATDAWERLCAVSSRRPAFRIPAPLDLVASLNLVVMAEVPGLPLSALLEDETMLAAAERGVRAAAAGIAALHDQPASFSYGRERSVRGDIESLRERNGRLHLVAGDFAQRVEALLDRLESAAVVDASPAPLIHGDYKPSQLLIDGECTYLVDFDSASPGDPAIDVGNFVAQLRKVAMLTDRPSVLNLASDFVSEYQSASCHAALGTRVQIVEVVALTRLAVRALRHAPHECTEAGSRSLPARLLEEAERCSTRL